MLKEANRGRRRQDSGWGHQEVQPGDPDHDQLHEAAETLHHHDEVRVGQVDQEPGLSLDHQIPGQEPDQGVLGPGIEAGQDLVADQELHEDPGQDQEEDHQEDIQYLLEDPDLLQLMRWRGRDSTWLIWTVTPPREIWRTYSPSMDPWLRSGWRGVFPASHLLCSSTRRMRTKRAELLMVRRCVVAESESPWPSPGPGDVVAEDLIQA